MLDNDYRKISIEELTTLSRFTSAELEEFIRSMKMLIANKGTFDSVLKKNVVNNCTEVIDYLPKITHIHLIDTTNALTKLLRLLIEFAQKYPNNSLTPTILSAITEINNYFLRFQIVIDTSQSSSELSNTPSDNDEEDSRLLHQRVVNPNATPTATRESYDRLIRDICKTAKDSQLETSDTFKQIANGLATRTDSPTEYDKAVSELLLRGVSNLKDREAKYNNIKQQLSLDDSPTDRKKKRREDMITFVADGLFAKVID